MGGGERVLRLLLSHLQLKCSEAPCHHVMAGFFCWLVVLVQGLSRLQLRTGLFSR